MAVATRECQRTNILQRLDEVETLQVADEWSLEVSKGLTEVIGLSLTFSDLYIYIYNKLIGRVSML